MIPSDPSRLPPVLERVLALLPADQPVHLVGGAVRDRLLQRPTRDYDLVVPRDGIRTARRVANALQADFYPLDSDSDTGRVIVQAEQGDRLVLDFSVYRGEGLEADLRARDFTINALAIDLRTQALVDPLGGTADLRARQLRICGPDSIPADPVRILRAVRLAVGLGLAILPETRQALRAGTPLLGTVSAERLRDELFKILAGPRPGAAVRTLGLLGILPHLLPELAALDGVAQPPPHVHDVWQHTLRVLDHLEAILAALAPGYDADSTNDLLTGLLTLRLGRYRAQLQAHLDEHLNQDRSPRALLFFAALYHDAAKPGARSLEDGRIRFLGHEVLGADLAAGRARALCLSNAEVARLEAVIRHHMRVHAFGDRLLREGTRPSRRAVYRFFRDAGPAGVDLCLLALADRRATYDHSLTQDVWAAALDVCRELLEAWWERREERVLPPALLNGDDLQRELGMPPGRALGQLLELMREAQAAGRLSSRDQALAFGREWLQSGRDPLAEE